MSGNHTPTPWKVSPGHAEGAVTVRQDGGEFQRPVAEVWHNGDDPKANAEFIVLACNSYASSQAEIERLRTALREIAFARPAGPTPKLVKGDLIERIETIAINALDGKGPARAALSGSKP